jgi:3-isopropylmalate dehydrogenase
MAAIGAAQMMMDHLGETEAAIAIENANKSTVAGKLQSLSAGKMGYTTTEVGDMVAEAVSG